MLEDVQGNVLGRFDLNIMVYIGLGKVRVLNITPLSFRCIINNVNTQSLAPINVEGKFLEMDENIATNLPGARTYLQERKRKLSF